MSELDDGALIPGDQPAVVAPDFGAREAVGVSQTSDSPAVVVRYFAAAREAAGVAQTCVPAASTLAELVDGLGADVRLAEVLGRCTFLVDGVHRALHDPTPLASGATVDVLPPFAGG